MSLKTKVRSDNKEIKLKYKRQLSMSQTQHPSPPLTCI